MFWQSKKEPASTDSALLIVILFAFFFCLVLA